MVEKMILVSVSCRDEPKALQWHSLVSSSNSVRPCGEQLGRLWESRRIAAARGVLSALISYRLCYSA